MSVFASAPRLTLAALLVACGSPEVEVSERAEAVASCALPSDCPAVGAALDKQCTGGLCLPTQHPGSCGSDPECSDANPCTSDSCAAGVCVSAPLAGAGCCVVALTDCAAPNRCQSPARCTAASCSYVKKSGAVAADCCAGSSECGTGATCVANICSCGPGQRYCTGSKTCVPSGGCCSGFDCDLTFSLGALCTAGTCTYTGCAGGHGDCLPAAPNTDGCETDLTLSASDCGACGRACAATRTLSVACSAGVCRSTCQPGFGNCSRPSAPAADDGCETDTTDTLAHCGGCSLACPGGNSCQTPVCAASKCGFAAVAADGCCAAPADCTVNNCQVASCVANRCTLTGKPAMSGCCTLPDDCPPQSNPCVHNLCTANRCLTMVMPGCMPDLASPEDLSPTDLRDAGDDLSLEAPDLAGGPPQSDLALGGLSLSGGGGCALCPTAPPSSWLLLAPLLLLLCRRRRP